jgi:hypothetical protein
MTMLTYQVEMLDDKLIAEMIPRQNEYWHDAEPVHYFPPDIDWPTYYILQQNGVLKIVIGRDEGVIKAAAFIVIAPHPHLACMSASLSLVYVAHESRKGREGIKLIQAAEKVAEESGAQIMMTHGGTHNHVGKIFEFMKYDDFGRFFVKALPNGPNGTKPIFKVVQKEDT